MRKIIARTITDNILADFFRGKVVVVVGPRQVGKTTLVETILAKFASKNRQIKTINCDNPGDRTLLENRDLAFLQEVVGDAKIVFIDEGQKVQTIGQSLKLLVDFYKDTKQFIVTGSSSFNLLDKTTEALTGRKRVYHLYPLSFLELYPHRNLVKINQELESRLIYGHYPEIINEVGFDQKKVALEEIASSQLYKDILEFQGIKDSNAIRNLLKSLALQVGSQVSYTELASLIGIDKNTVTKYVDLLEKNFIIFRLPPYSTNKRKEIGKLKKIYFYDNGVRNAIIQNFSPLELRNDVGALWENFLTAERMKKREYQKIYAHQYFWRTYDGQEIDLVEEREGKLFGYEFKWSDKSKVKPPRAWTRAYPQAEFQVVDRGNYLDFID